MGILLELFLVFLEIGAVSFGGGYAMISLIREKVLLHGWLTEAELLNMIAVAESTPGPIAINMATFVGSTQAGITGAICATVGVVLPSFVIILLISAVINNFMKYRGVQAFVGGIRPCAVGLILATSVTMLMSILFGFKTVGTPITPDIRGLIILAIIVGLSLLSKKVLKKKPSPIIMILISAGLGMILYSF